MNAPIFKVSTTTCPSVAQYFKWKSGVGDTYALTGCSIAEVNGAYEFLSSDSNYQYYQNSTNTDYYIVRYSSYYDDQTYLCYTTSPITSNAPYYSAIIMYYGGFAYAQPQVQMESLPVVTTTNMGSGYFSYKMDDADWSADTTGLDATVTGLEDISSHTFYIREKLSDDTYTTTATAVFNVVFSQGVVKPSVRISSIQTDKSSFDVIFNIANYGTKILGGLTVDILGVGGMYICAGIKNEAPYYINGVYYLFYASSLSRWIVTTVGYFNDESTMYGEPYYSYIYANSQTGPETFPTDAWYAGMMADWSIQGTPSWTSGAFNVIPLGTKTHRYKVDSGSYITLDNNVNTFNISINSGNLYVIYISELLDNGLWTPEVLLNIDCALLDAPTVTTGSGSTTSADGYNVSLKWTSVGSVLFNGTSYATPIFWDETTAVEISTPYGAGKKFHVTNLKSANGCFIAFKLLPNTTYYVMVQDEEGNMQNAEYKPDGTLYRGIHDYEYAWESIETGSNGGIWEYQTIDQGSWGNFSLAVYPSPEVVTAYDSGTFYSNLTGAITGMGIFRYKINSGSWSAETIIRNSVQMFQLPTGVQDIQVQEKSINSIWGKSGLLELTVIAGAEVGTTGGITVPNGKYIVVFNPTTGKEFLWDGAASITGLDTMFV